MSVKSLGMSLDSGDSVRVWASRSEDWACLVIEADGACCEIRLDRVHVQTLRDHLPGVVAGLDRWAAEDAACEQAVIAGRRATDLAARALDLAVAAEAVQAHELARSLRAAVAEAAEKADATDAAVRAFGNAVADADFASERLLYATREAEQALRRSRGDERPAEPATP